MPNYWHPSSNLKVSLAMSADEPIQSLPQQQFVAVLGDEMGGIKIPTRPAILAAITRELHAAAPNYAMLEGTIALDVSLSGALVKIANSALFGSYGSVRTIKGALQRLGLGLVANTIAALALRNTFAHVPNLERFWDSSARIAQLSAWLAPRFVIEGRKVRADEAYTFGLFRDCGIPVLMSFYSTYFDVLKAANEDSSRAFTAVEEEDIGIDHTIIGSMLIKEWELPAEFGSAIEIHHNVGVLNNPDAASISDLSRYLVAIAQLAEFLFQRITGLNKTCEWEKLGKACCAILCIHDEDIERMIEDSSLRAVCAQPII
jgi:HD-like signal output (HDOD) protein